MFSTSLVAAATAAFNSSESVLAFFSSLYFCPVSLLCRSCRNGLFICRNSVFSALPPLRGLPCPFAPFCLVCFQAVFLRFFLWIRTRACHVPFVFRLRFLIPFASFARRLPGCRLLLCFFAVFGGFLNSFAASLPPVFYLSLRHFCLFLFAFRRFGLFFLFFACFFTSAERLCAASWAATAGVEKRASGQAEGVCSAWFDLRKSWIILKAARKQPDVWIILSVMPSENAVCPILHLLCADTCNRLKQPYIVRHIFNAATDIVFRHTG
ncbi:Uncharacterised protein [Neisseria gonorrhoeae]|uniref:Transmembrane protein n=1 Tax=Neisseria gonorrhoeae TaxID=485 RepID=A0A378VZ00_NEIGO|nr:Uncharacterised protein [Neisseria gonorrhoeae]